VARPNSKLETFKDLTDKSVGVQGGTIQERQLEKVAKKMQGLKVVRFKRVPDLIQAIRDKQVTAAILEDRVAATYVEDSLDPEFTVIENQDPVQFAIAFPKGSEIVEKVNRVIQEMQDSGEMELLIRRWFARQQ
jgi:arginine/lysine/histidine transporter system substrate-binding protein